MPYGISVTGTKLATQLPLLALHYTDGYVPVSPWLPGLNTLANITYNITMALPTVWAGVQDRGPGC